MAIGNRIPVNASINRISDAHAGQRADLPPSAHAVRDAPGPSGWLNGLLETSHSSVTSRMAGAMPLSSYADKRATKKRIARVHEIFGILIDETTASKPHLAKHETWLIDLIDAMKKGNFVTQYGAEYVHSPGVPTPDIMTLGTELCFETSDAAQAAKKHFRDRDIQVAVPGFRGRKPDDHRRLRQLTAADAIVLAKGDFHAPYQIVEVLRCVRSGEVRGTPIVVPGPVLDFYQPLWHGLFGRPPKKQSAREFYQTKLTHWIRSGQNSDPDAPIFFPESLEDIQSGQINAAIGSDRSTRLSAPGPGDALDELDAMFVEPQRIARLHIGTTKLEKAAHWGDVRLLMELFDGLGDPDELHKSYIGNVRGIGGDVSSPPSPPPGAWLFRRLPQSFRPGAPKTPPPGAMENSGKAEQHIRQIREVLNGEHRDVSRAAFLQRLESFGIDAQRGDKLHFLNDDRGFEFPEWSKIEPYFDPKVKKDALDLIACKVGGQNTKVQAVPGVETTWWINAAGGMEALMTHFHNAFEAYEEAKKERLERKVTSVVAVSVTEMDLNEPYAAKVQNFSGATTFEFRRPAKGKLADTSECWYVPTENNPDHRSIQEYLGNAAGVPDFNALLPWVRARRAMEAAGIEFDHASAKRRVADYRIDFVGEQRKTRGAALQQHVDRYVAERLPAPSGADAIASAKPIIERTSPSRYREMFKGFGFDPFEILDRVDGSDAMVFDSVGPSVPAQEQALPLSVAALAEKCYDLLSVLVIRSLHPDYKGMQVMFNANDPQLKALAELVAIQHKFALSEDMSMIAQPYTDQKEVVAALERHWNGYERIRTPAIQSESKPQVLDLDEDFRGGERPARPSVVVLGSGKAENRGALNSAETTAEWIARRGLDARTGGGAKGVMGAVGRRFREVVDELDNGAMIAGVSTQMVVGKETDTGKLPDELDFAHVTEDIVTRMVALFGADMAVFLDGGIGTAQELFFAIALKADDHPLVKGKPMIAVNSLMPDGQRLMDGYMAVFGAGDPSLTTREARIAKGREIFAKMDIHVIDPGHDDAAEVITRRCDEIAQSYGIVMDAGSGREAPATVRADG